MRPPCQRRRPRGATTVEFAVTCPLAIFLIFQRNFVKALLQGAVK